jgi:phage antirepressor YoqD-like protein
MSKSDTLSAKEVAAMCNMTAKNFRKHLRENSIQSERKQKQYQFTSKQADKIVAQFTAEELVDVEDARV